MQIRKIVNKTKEEFPELNSMSEVDFFNIWKTYEEEITNKLLQPELPYLQFLTVGTFGLTDSAFIKKTRTIGNMDNNLIEDNIDNSMRKLQKFEKITKTKKEYYESFITYLDGLNTSISMHGIKLFNKRIDKFNLLLNQINKYKENYVKKIITRDLEK